MEKRKGNKFTQLHIEKEQQNQYIESYLRKLNEAIENNRFDETPEGILLIRLGFLEYRNKIASFLNEKSTGGLQKVKNFINLLSDDPDELALIAIKVIVSRVGKKSSTLTSTAENITKKLSELHFFNRLKSDNPKLHTYLGREYRDASKKRKEELVRKHIDKLYKIDFDTNMSDKKLAVKVGSILIDLLVLSGAGIVEKRIKRVKGKKLDVISMTSQAVEILLEHSNKNVVIQGTNMLPLVVPPNDWQYNDKGGYLLHKINLVKTNSKRHKNYISDNRKEMDRVFGVVNKLQHVAWRVNEQMYNIVREVFYSNILDPRSPKTLPRCIGEIPSSHVYKAEDLIEPSPGFPDETQGVDVYNEGLKVWGEWNKKREKVKIDLDAEESRRLDVLNALAVAEKMVEFEDMYYVMQLDYRGRVYYNNQFLNPQAKGYIKSILEFANGRKLNSKGIKWLKIHIANVAGQDKELFHKRNRWFKDNEADIIRIGKDPMNNISLWMHKDSPFEYVAACISYTKSLKGEEVHLPLQLDATNSGIQFYSGLVNDKEGAQTVNVVNKIINGEIVRADIYQDVADLVNKKLKEGDYIKKIDYKDSEGVSHIHMTHREADSLKGKINRSITKKNTMTVAYSVTSRGMMDQNWKTMKEAELNNEVFWEGKSWAVNKVLTDLNERSIYESIKGAKLGQEYLKEVAGKLDDTAKWYSPIYNFPILQPSYKMDEERINTPLGKLTLRMSNDIELNRRKQLSSIAANFIHSLDSALLMYCVENATGDIGVIHDCFLVHPNDAEEVRDNYRKGYVEIMKTKPLETFQKGLKLDPEDEVEIPNIGTLNLDDVLDAEYMLS